MPLDVEVLIGEMVEVSKDIDARHRAGDQPDVLRGLCSELRRLNNDLDTALYLQGAKRKESS
jgi:hypothetical protein